MYTKICTYYSFQTTVSCPVWIGTIGTYYCLGPVWIGTIGTYYCLGPGWIGTAFQSNQDNRQSSKNNNKYQLLYTYGCTS